MNYEETIAYLFAHLPMYQRIGDVAYKKDLTNIAKLCAILGNPQDKMAFVHVAGTNGKGSVSNMIASVLQEAGYRTGLYTSPHLLDFRERIRVNGVLCNPEFVVRFVDRMRGSIEVIQPSFFEITVAMAFAYFTEENVDIAVMEVGLGGRLDSTNIIHPLLSVITNVGYDHMHLLGNTLEAIAFEKAGIIKPDVPVVIGEYHPETFSVFSERAQSLHAPLLLAEKQMHAGLIARTHTDMEVNITKGGEILYPGVRLDLPGDYQRRNVCTTLASIEILRQLGLDIEDQAIYRGLDRVRINTGFSGRWQVLGENPLVIADCAHNPDGLRTVFTQINSMSFANLRIVTGMVRDKDIAASLGTFPSFALYYFTRPDVPRGLDADTLRAEAAKTGLQGECYENVKEALKAAIAESDADDMVLLCGSIFVVAEALRVYDDARK